ncbi:MAG: hypothetical protein WBA45_14860 [Microthrixaceae bacterium]
MRRQVRVLSWFAAGCAVVASWLAGLGMWGAPEVGFTAGLPIFNWILLVVVGVPAMVIAALAEGGTVGRGAAWRIVGMVV